MKILRIVIYIVKNHSELSSLNSTLDTTGIMGREPLLDTIPEIVQIYSNPGQKVLHQIK